MAPGSALNIALTDASDPAFSASTTNNDVRVRYEAGW
jgi:hypothetical protein